MIRRLGVVGAGTMGSGIAQLALQSGLEVLLFDSSPAALRAGLDRIREGLMKAGRMELLPRLEPFGTLEALAPAEAVVEAAFEDPKVKQDIFSRLDSLLPSPRLLASNTSSIPIARIAGAASRPERVIGLHFFNPAPVMRLVEVIPHAGTSPEAEKAALELASALGKTPVRCKDSPGFIANRLARPFYLQPMRRVERGEASVTAVDRALREAGFRMGPFELMDLIGLDVNLAITNFLHSSLGERFRPAEVQARLVERGELGRKTGKGFYLYQGKKPSGENPALGAVLRAYSPGSSSTAGLFEAVLQDVLAEAQRLVEEGVATGEDIDTAMRLGLNWPEGPFAWARRLGLGAAAPSQG